MFPDLRDRALALDRRLDPAAVAGTDPRVVIRYWCGVGFNPDLFRTRPGWSHVDAVGAGHLYSVKPTCKIEPGPGALTGGVRQLHCVIARSMGMDVDPDISPEEKVDPALPASV